MKKNVFLGPIEVCGILYKLKKGISRDNYSADIFCLKPYVYSDSKSYENVQLDGYFRIYKRIKNCNNGLKLRLLQIKEAYELLTLFVRIIHKYDYYLYLYARGIFSFNPFLRRVDWAEFLILKLLKKRVVVLCCGSDTRPPFCGISNNTGMQLKKETRRVARNVRMIEKYALLIDGASNAYFHTKPYISYNCIGNIVSEEDRILCGNRDSKNERVVIFHAPSSASIKGTEYIQKIIDEIESEGYNVEYVMLSGVDHDRIIEQISKSDIVVDELYSDFPMAMLDAEAAINGVPVVTCGYYAEQYQEDMPEPIPPSIYTTEKQLKNILIELIENKQLREEIGEKEQNFIYDNWIDRTVGEKIIKLFEGDYSKDWLYYPEKSQYLFGAGCSKEMVKKKVVDLVTNYGMKSLCLKKDSYLYKGYYEMYRKEMADNEQ